jgi:F-type H+-transporting ATPase subunit b
MAAEAAQGGHPEAGAHAADGHAGVFPPFDASLFTHQLFWFALTFGALYLILSRVALPRVADVLERRAAQIRADLDAAARESNAAEAARKQMERTQAESRAAARTLVERMRGEAQGELAAEQARLERELSEQAQAEEARIAEARARALAQVEAIAADVAEDIVARVAGPPAPAARNASPAQKVRA